MGLTSLFGMAIKCCLSWIAVSYIANYVKLTKEPLLECYPFKLAGRWKSIFSNIIFYLILSLIIVSLHVSIWSFVKLGEASYITSFAMFVALCHGVLAAYLVLRNRKREERKPMAMVVLYWHLLCGLFVGLVIEMDLLEKWLIQW